MIYNKNYQLHDKVESTLNTKTKGFGYTPYSAIEKSIRNYNISDYIQNELLVGNSAAQKIIYDTADYIIPANQNQQTFIMTNFDLFVQSMGTCKEVNPMANVIFEHT